MQGLSIITHPNGQPKTAMIDLDQHDEQLNQLVAGLLQLLDQQRIADEERADFARLSLSGLSSAYGEDEYEYTEADCVWLNPDFKPL